MYYECTTCTICCIARTGALFIHIARSSFHNRSWSLSYGFFVFLVYASQNKRFPIVSSAGTSTDHLTRQHRSHNNCSGYLCSHLNSCAAYLWLARVFQDVAVRDLFSRSIASLRVDIRTTLTSRRCRDALTTSLVTSAVKLRSSGWLRHNVQTK